MMRRCIRALALTALGLGAPAVAGAQSTAGTVPFETFTLDNGLRVILSQDRTTPVVAVDVWYDVGSRDERRGRTGFAHLFEHMMFQGSENVGKAEHLQLVERAGGSMNGTTNEDRTNYFETLPSNRLNLGLWLEADRMRSLAVTQENLDNQIEVVKEERRLRIDNSPYGSSYLAALYTLPYDSASCYGYGHTVIGSMEDLEAATLEDVREFFDVYYAPNNATLAVVGDFDPAVARSLIQEYFGDIPRGEPRPQTTCTAPFSHLPQRRVIEDENANLPAIFLSYGMPEAGHPDTYALSLLASILGGGESSRLHQRLVKEEQAAVTAAASAQIRRGPGLTVLYAIANQGVEAERLGSLLEEVVAGVRADGVTPEELERAKNQYRARTIMARQTALGRAEALQHYAHFHGDPAAMPADLERYLAVNLEDVRRAAQQYLVPANRATVVTQPTTGGEE